VPYTDLYDDTFQPQDDYWRGLQSFKKCASPTHLELTRAHAH